MTKLTTTEQLVLTWARDPDGVHVRSPRFVIGRGNGYMRAALALIRKGLAYWDTDNPRILRAKS